MKAGQSPEPSISPGPILSESRPLRAAKSFATKAVKRVWAANPDIISFEQLYARESWQLKGEVTEDSIRVLTGVAAEPWVSFTPQDRFGLALSGGGIRSATFNLGLMQALAHLGVLKEVDYLSTVSGGGYVGGFWMAWLKRKGTGRGPGPERFPLGNDRRGGERAEVRHLREFSRFLLPRVGAMHTEFWGIAMTILGGLLPSLLAAISMLFLFWVAWLTVTGVVLLAHPVGAIALGIALAGYLILAELIWAKSGKSEYSRPALAGYVLAGLGGAALMVGAAWFWPEIFSILPAPIRTVSTSVPRVFFPALLLGAGTLILLFARVALARFCHRPASVSRLEGFERSLARFLGLTVLLLALGALWLVAGQFRGSFRIPVTVAGAAGSAALFAWAKKWLMSPVEETHGSNLLRTVINHLKRATPKLLATLAWLLLFLLVGAAIHGLGVDPEKFPSARYFWVFTAASTIVILTAWLFDPARVGMHEFYRSRISRCYLGASNLSDKGAQHTRAADNRHVVERPNDDLTLKDLSSVSKPVHLICTAANDVSGDPLGTLYRGARSAVLSANGISLGDQTAKLDDLRLSAALTASAAAFNSQMGRFSMDLGPTVTFLMSALNLRLGLWVPHPTNRYRGQYLFPGRFFLYELLGRSRVNGKHLHLSDGNHFENFGLYELIRRHTRYIIVSDCGADPEIAFDDLANVLRRVREDFGVEIDLDISALRPAENGLSKQHAVVGTIHYNGVVGMDKGTILFFKPALTGDEPPDVLQYRTRNRAFPHESTGDQFYDEPQWESYRRLGEHAGRMVLGFFEQPDSKISSQVDKLFSTARSHWHPAPDRHAEGFLEMTERCASLEAELSTDGPRHLRSEVFSEVTELAGARVFKPRPDEEMQIISYLLRLLQIMEDVWLGADLEHYWSHPLNEGWMSYFHRWASTPSFRRWWPILAPIYSFGFRGFVKERFGVGVQDKSARPDSERSITAGQLFLSVVEDPEKFMTRRTWQSFKQCHPTASILPGSKLFSYELELLGYDGKAGAKRLPIGLLIATEQHCEENENLLLGEPDAEEVWRVSWRSTELFIPLALHGSGILARLLDSVIRYYDKRHSTTPARKYVQLEVQFSPDEAPSKGKKSGPRKPKVLSQAARQQRVREIEFYKSRGFRYITPEKESGEIILILPLRGS